MREYSVRKGTRVTSRTFTLLLAGHASELERDILIRRGINAIPREVISQWYHFRRSARVSYISRYPVAEATRGTKRRNRCPHRSSHVEKVPDSDNASLEAANVINEEHRAPSLSCKITPDEVRGKGMPVALTFATGLPSKFRSDERYDGKLRATGKF